MGSAVSRGRFAVKEAPPKGAGLVSARKGTEPVAVGPKYQSVSWWLAWLGRFQQTSENLGSGLKVLRDPSSAGVSSRGSLLLLQDSCARQAEG